MKRIGIITFQNADNYGAVLQAYALKETLKNIGCYVDILNYYNSKLQKEYKGIPSFKKNIKDLIYPVKLVLFPILRLFVATRFKSFRKKYLLDTPPIYPNTIKNYNKDYDAFICGSDQIFNPRITGFDKNYFLDFVQNKNKSFSYAASFGLSYENLTDKEKLFIKQNLQNFKHLSLREQQGIDIVNKLSNIKSEFYIDPTLLLNKKQWEKFYIKPKNVNYVLLYFMHTDVKLINLAKNLSNKTGCRLVFISHGISFKKNINAVYIKPTPSEWISLFLNAKYIITNSFHGLCFSINFNKAFFINLQNNVKINSRIENLLDLTNLKDRLINNIGTDYDKLIDWNNVNKIIEQERKKSFNYLKEITK